MKNLLTVVGMLFSHTCLAQAPQGMNYQAVIRDNIGFPITNQQVGMRMSIMENSVTLYAETHEPTTNDMGLVNMVIGQGTVEQGVFEDIDWANGTFMVQTEADVTGGTNYVILGAQQLMSVPYALYAEAAGQPASVSTIGDTLFLGDGTSIVIPGISGANGGLGNGVYIPGGGVIDVDGNSYPTVILGDQEWMAENLRTSKYANGDDIPYDELPWPVQSSNVYAWPNNDQTMNIPYGKLYGQDAMADTRKLCPAGWHIPTGDEWNTLITYLGGNGVAGGKMKTINSQLWLWLLNSAAPNSSASNLSGLSMVATGVGYYDINQISVSTYLCAIYLFAPINGYGISVCYETGAAEIDSIVGGRGSAIRCIKDQ